MDLPPRRSGRRRRAALGRIHSRGSRLAGRHPRLEHAGVVAFPAIPEGSRHGAPRPRVSTDRIRQLGDPAPMAADGGPRELRAGASQDRAVPLLRGPPQIPEADLHGAHEDAGRPGPRPRRFTPRRAPVTTPSRRPPSMGLFGPVAERGGLGLLSERRRWARDRFSSAKRRPMAPSCVLAAAASGTPRVAPRLFLSVFCPKAPTRRHDSSKDGPPGHLDLRASFQKCRPRKLSETRS